MLRTASLVMACLSLNAYAQETGATHDLADCSRGRSDDLTTRNSAFVKDLRRIPSKRGGLNLAFRDVSANMRAETALLRSGVFGSVSVLEQILILNCSHRRKCWRSLSVKR